MMKSSKLLPSCIIVFILTSITMSSSQNNNYALQFDGIDDEVNMGFSSILDITGDITISVWYKTVSPYWGALVCNHRHISPDNGYELCSSSLYAEGGFVFFECALNDSFTGQKDRLSTNAVFNDGQWHYITAVYTPNGYSRVKIFVDGIEQTGYYHSPGVPLPAIGATPGYPFRVGAANSQAFFDGVIDEVSIWNVAWTQAEVQANMFSKVSAYEPGLVGYWSFNEGAGDTAYDYSGNGNHGAIHGATWVPSTAPTSLSFFFANPNIAYLNHPLFTSFRGTNTHFTDSTGTTNVWLSKGDATIQAHSFTVHSNFFLDAVFMIPPDVPTGLWHIHIESAIDSVINMNNGIEILSPPAIVPQSSGTSHWLKGISAVDEYHAWAVGNQGTVVMTTDGGESWAHPSSGTVNTLNAVHFVDSNTGWTVGQSGIILNTTNGGSDWTPQNSGTVNNLQSVFFNDASRGWVVGSNGTILSTTDGGTTWTPQSSGTSAWLYAVYFSDADRGWATGSSGTILRTTDGGNTWTPQSSGTLEYLFSTHFIDAVSGWAVGSGGTILKTSDGGSSWSTQTSGTSNWLRSVCFTSADTGFAVGNAGTFLMSSDGGNSWEARRSWTSNTLNGLCFADHKSGWMVGEAGTIMKMSFQGVLTSIDDGTISRSPLPQEFALLQNYPNPFNPITTIKYNLPKTSKVILKVYNLLGQEVRTLVNGVKAAGHHGVVWDGRDQFNRAVSSGVYIYSTQAGLYLQSKKMVLLK
jgi:photosystem II stability/assembly factor-like uncharacterized protein